MNLSGPFIRRPVATMLLSLAIMLLGGVSFGLLPVSPLPQMDFPVIVVQASLPGASPRSWPPPWPRRWSASGDCRCPTLTSRSSQGSTRVIISSTWAVTSTAPRGKVQAAINASRNLLPSGMRSMPTYKKINPSQAPIMVLSLTSSVLSKGQLMTWPDHPVPEPVPGAGVGEVQIGGSSLPAVRIELEPQALNQYGLALDDVRTTVANANQRRPKGFVEDRSATGRSRPTTSWKKPKTTSRS
jgi:multidrug efflux pump